MTDTLSSLRASYEASGWSAVSGVDLDAEGRMLAAEEKLSED